MSGAMLADRHPMLPVELIIMIMADLENGVERLSRNFLRSKDARHPKADLSSCALVCRAWRELARPFLFQDFFFRFRRSIPGHGFSDELSYGRKKLDQDSYEYMVAHRTLKDLLQFLTDNPLIAKRMRKLVLHLHIEPVMDATLRDPYPSELVAILDPTVIPSLRHLELSNVVLDGEVFDLEEDVELDYHAVIPHLERLYIHEGYHNWSNMDINAVRRLLNLFGSIDELFLGDIHGYADHGFYLSPYHNHPDNSDTAVPTDLQIRRLILDNISSNFVFSSMPASGSTLPNLTSLDIGTVSKFVHASRFITEFGSNLVNISLDIHSNIAEEVVAQVDLSTCRRLETLTLRMDLWPTSQVGYEHINEASLSFVYHVLRSCPHLPALTRVVFVFTLGFGLYVDPASDPDFEAQSSEFLSVEEELLSLTECTPLREVVVAPAPDPFRFDYNVAQLGFEAFPHWHTWRAPQFPQQLFPKIKEAGKLDIMGITSSG